MAPPFTIAPASPSDAAGLIALRTAVVAEGGFLIAEPGEHAPTLDAVMARIRAASTGASSAVWVARARFQVVGMLEVQPAPFRRNRHVGHLEIMVRADWRGRGVGRALMEALLAWSPGSALSKLALAVYAHNAPAIALYRAYGFTEEGRRIAEYRFPDGTLRDDVLMARPAR